jgi:prephenate dehydrogenase
MDTVGIIGFGNFGQFMAKHLRPYFDIAVFDTDPNQKIQAESLGVEFGSLDTVARKSIVVLAVPVQRLEDVLKSRPWSHQARLFLM